MIDAPATISTARRRDRKSPYLHRNNATRARTKVKALAVQSNHLQNRPVENKDCLSPGTNTTSTTNSGTRKLAMAVDPYQVEMSVSASNSFNSQIPSIAVSTLSPVSEQPIIAAPRSPRHKAIQYQKAHKARRSPMAAAYATAIANTQRISPSASPKRTRSIATNVEVVKPTTIKPTPRRQTAAATTTIPVKIIKPKATKPRPSSPLRTRNSPKTPISPATNNTTTTGTSTSINTNPDPPAMHHHNLRHHIVNDPPALQPSRSKDSHTTFSTTTWHDERLMKSLNHSNTFQKRLEEQAAEAIRKAEKKTMKEYDKKLSNCLKTIEAIEKRKRNDLRLVELRKKAEIERFETELAQQIFDDEMKRLKDLQDRMKANVLRLKAENTELEQNCRHMATRNKQLQEEIQSRQRVQQEVDQHGEIVSQLNNIHQVFQQAHRTAEQDLSRLEQDCRKEVKERKKIQKWIKSLIKLMDERCDHPVLLKRIHKIDETFQAQRELVINLRRARKRSSKRSQQSGTTAVLKRKVSDMRKQAREKTQILEDRAQLTADLAKRRQKKGEREELVEREHREGHPKESNETVGRVEEELMAHPHEEEERACRKNEKKPWRQEVERDRREVERDRWLEKEAKDFREYRAQVTNKKRRQRDQREDREKPDQREDREKWVQQREDREKWVQQREDRQKQHQAEQEPEQEETFHEEDEELAREEEQELMHQQQEELKARRKREKRARWREEEQKLIRQEEEELMQQQREALMQQQREELMQQQREELMQQQEGELIQQHEEELIQQQEEELKARRKRDKRGRWREEEKDFIHQEEAELIQQQKQELMQQQEEELKARRKREKKARRHEEAKARREEDKARQQEENERIRQQLEEEERARLQAEEVNAQREIHEALAARDKHGMEKKVARTSKRLNKRRKDIEEIVNEMRCLEGVEGDPSVPLFTLAD
ncbi:expressed unknown protein [Seminavis robusta]|uniref:Uncharacterized protein n=1 Tax=Seminavis robusta TaxID=568900 RepID=A0A9N8DKW1_9STRA|nr:expressed unknown protein [Seminavis robusta]|eukprot:Sro185_g080280.1 n/a (949) ;mRNA; r:33760-36606